jgi:hypothetical protein
MTRRETAERLRAVPLGAVLRALGAEPDLRDRHKWHTPAGVLSICGAKFINWHRGRGGGGAIDLVMHVADLPFAQALRWLEDRFAGAPLPVCSGCAPPTPPSAPASDPSLPWRPPPPHPPHLARVLTYLTGARGLASALLERHVAAGTLYADARANAVFILLGPGPEHRRVGAELRGTGPLQWRGMAPGSRKDLGFFAVASASLDVTAPAILCESAIDALSCALLHPDHRCLSTSGARPDPLWLAPVLAHSSRLYCGFDADPTGDAMAREMIARHPGVRRLRPPLHDWNDVLLARA